MGWLRRAFAVERRGSALTPRQEELLEKLAKKVARWQMGVPAMMFLETIKPLSFIGSQVLVFLDPIVKSVFNSSDYDEYTKLMEDRKNVELLIRKIEDMSFPSTEKGEGVTDSPGASKFRDRDFLSTAPLKIWPQCFFRNPSPPPVWVLGKILSRTISSRPKIRFSSCLISKMPSSAPVLNSGLTI